MDSPEVIVYVQAIINEACFIAGIFPIFTDFTVADYLSFSVRYGAFDVTAVIMVVSGADDGFTTFAYRCIQAWFSYNVRRSDYRILNVAAFSEYTAFSCLMWRFEWIGS